MEFPDVWNGDLKKDNYQIPKDAIDYAISMHNKSRKDYNYIADNYNGTNIGKRFEYLTKTYAKDSRTKYVDYKIGRTKVSLLAGEFLTADLSASVSTQNRESMRRKYENYTNLRILSELKPQIETVRQMGMNVFPGVNIPDKNDIDYWKNASVKEKNEIIMQKLLNWRINKDKLKFKLLDGLVNNILYSEIHSVIEVGDDGVETISIIPPEDAMYLEIDGDIMLTKTPYKGRRKDMYFHDIMRVYGPKMDSDTKKTVEDFRHTISNADSKYYNQKDGFLSVTVHDIQIKCPEVIYFKKYTTKAGLTSTKKLSKKYVDENRKEIENPEKFGIEKYYKQSLFWIAKIGNEVYVPMGYVNNQIQTKKNRKNFYVEYDYTSVLPGTVNGVRVSIYEMIIDLSITYNIVRFMINRELQKIKGKALGYDKAFMEGKNIGEVMHRLTEDGLLVVNSAKEGLEDFNYNVLDKIFKEYDLGVSSSFQQLLMAANDIEGTIDRITGINQNREGITRATETATGINSSINASRSITNPMSYSTNIFIEETLRKLLEKIKINRNLFESDELGLILSDDEVNFIIATYDVSNDEYGVKVNDGRKETEIKAMIQQFYGQQVNAGMLSVDTIAKAEIQDSYSAYINVLQASWDKIQEAQAQAQQADAEQAQKDREFQIELGKENREDIQKHGLELEALKGQIKKDIEILKGQISGAQLGMELEVQKDMQEKQLMNEEQPTI